MTENERITHAGFLNLDGLSFGFSMPCYLDPQRDEGEILTEICKTISVADHEDKPIWARLLGGHHVLLVAPQDKLYQVLDEDSQGKSFIFLIFRRKGKSITVTHFGPFENKKKDEFKDTVDKTDSALAVLNMWKAMQSTKNETCAQEKKKEENNTKKELVKFFWEVCKDVEWEMESKKMELENFTKCVFNNPESREAADKLVGRLTASTGKVVLKSVTAVLFAELAEEIARKMAAKIAAKTAAKAAAKTSSKGAGKMAVKAVPVLGLAVGAAFGIWRLWQGDTMGAGLEVASGAAACLPGSGTAASLAIDAGLVAKDIYQANSEGKDLDAELKRLEHELDDFFHKYDVALLQYKFAAEVSEDVGFTEEKLGPEIEILNKVSTALHEV